MRSAVLLLSLSACVTDAPDVEVQQLIDTRDTTGPYQVRARVTDDGQVTEVTLIHGVLVGESADTQPVKMNADPLLEGVFTADIPGQPADKTIIYGVEAKDDQGNVGCGPPAMCPPTPERVVLSAYRFRIIPR
jgi:hypothetical protein